VGNRLQLDSSQDGVVTYQYDAANRLIEAGGVSYSWDANGNLLSDGTSTYTYNHANRLAGVAQDGVAYSYAYNGLGDRLQQSADGVATNYTLDLNAGLTQVLTDGTNTYLYGRGRIAQEGIATEYFLGDALNSVRQLVNSSVEVTLTQSYKPYGSLLASEGGGESIYQFTGEIKDSTGLTYLRARYANSGTASFSQKDPLGLESNQYLYASANPIVYSDPRGLDSGASGPAYFTFCIGLHTGLKGNVGWISAEDAVAYCRKGFNMNLWSSIPFNQNELNNDTPTSAHNLFGRFIFEKGKDDWIVFNGSDELTKELSKGTLINDIRHWYYSGGDPGEHTLPVYRGGDTEGPILYRFGVFEYFGSGMFGIKNSLFKGSLPIEFVMGSFNFQVLKITQGGETRLGFRIDNDMTIESGTHIPDRFPPVYEGSVEELIRIRPDLASHPLSEITNTIAPWGTKVISILSSHARNPQGYSDYGGGSLFQTFTWTERYDPCLSGHLPKEIPALNLGIGVWSNWRDDTQNPKEPFPVTGPPY
jgi:RHS repeat-associated protein